MSRLAAVLVILLLASSTRADDEAIYYVGNSLTAQAEPYRIWQMSNARGHAHERGLHIKCGAGLDYIWNHPTEFCVTPRAPYGTFSNALPNYDWSKVTLEPYYDTLAGPSGAVERIADFIALSQSTGRNAGTDFFVYSAWPTSTGASFDFSAAWDAEYNPAVSATRMTRDFMHQAAEALRDHPDVDGSHIFMVPVGDVLYELDQRMKAGGIDGFTSVQQLYNDAPHLTQIGNWIAGMTFYSTFWGESPVGLSASYYGQTLTPEQTLAFQETVWDVVSTHPFTVPEPIAALPLLIGLLALRRARCPTSRRPR
jgi:hypothetical protein